MSDTYVFEWRLQSATGQLTCTECAAGTHQMAEAQSSCTACPADTYEVRPPNVYTICTNSMQHIIPTIKWFAIQLCAIKYIPIWGTTWSLLIMCMCRNMVVNHRAARRVALETSHRCPTFQTSYLTFQHRPLHSCNYNWWRHPTMDIYIQKCVLSFWPCWFIKQWQTVGPDRANTMPNNP